MQLYDLISPAESRIADKAYFARSPLGGSMELLPLCNMNCKMCFIRQNPEEMKKQGRMLSCDEWLRIAREAKAAGVVFLLLTGGEPLFYPEFRRLYSELTSMGFFITINTNGTLIDEDMADFLAARPCRRLNITLYGDSDESYARLCGNPHGHTQLMRALELLEARKVPYRLNYSITPDNVGQLRYGCELAHQKHVALEAAAYMFPPMRRENERFERLSPKQAAQAKHDWILYRYGEKQLEYEAKLAKERTERFEPRKDDTITCRAGRSGFWMAWNGDLLSCGMMPEPKVSLLDHSFAEAWKTIVAETDKLRIYSGCRTCAKRHVCSMCAAGCLAESGDMTKKPEYLCEMAEAYYDLLMQHLPPQEEKKEETDEPRER